MLLVLSSVFLLVSLVVIFKLKNTRYGLFHVLIIYFSLSLIDVIIPVILWSIYGRPIRPFWFTVLSDEDLAIGMLYYYIFYMIFFLTFVISNHNTRYKNFSYSIKGNINKKYIKQRLLYFSIISGLLYLFSLYYEIIYYGGFSEWVVLKFTVRFSGGIINEDQGILDLLITRIPWRLMFHSLVLLAFLFRFKHNRQFLYGRVFPFLDIIFSLSTSYRGSILQVLLGLIFIEYIRINIHKYNNYNSGFGIGKEKILSRKYYVFSILIFTAFFVYGSLRSNFENKVYERTAKQDSTIYRVFSQGSGIEGVSSIIKEYRNQDDFLGGKTYVDMLLLPIPRTIYTSKPEWYGIDDITRNMGWPKSTQSAVTMPGEAYANFGWFGLIIAVVYGLFFSFIIKLISRKGGVYMIVYPSIIMPLVFVSNWMAFTGVMNMFFNALIITFLLLSVFVRFKKL